MKDEFESAINALKEEKEKALQEASNTRKKIGRLEEALSIKDDETEKICKFHLTG